ncbi:IS66-like element accessory protein TnpA [Methylobacterium nodulans]|uniref:Transposase IS3/IS911 family protein n=1 Tax=Methylobacterium nodulans (strain LMG 21967 / CNCM I-2342 / ORS 2060) TaxID=460265 RepID=B8IVR9_METNO|nr:transposase [Methylobacterium nodulans]ACL62509.1 transposase IS3/IS911 family protein [Methylobacterium nodulans ORS 2060]
MDSHTHSARLRRLEIVETGRRRCWSEDEKLKVVRESLQRPRLVSATARRYGISRSLLLTWRRAFAASRSAPAVTPTFVPAVVVPAPEPTRERAETSRSSSTSSRMVIVLGKGRRIVVDASVEAEAPARVLAVLEGR